MAVLSTRAGRYVQQQGGYRAFIPAPLPPDPPIQVDAAMLMLLSRAAHAVGRLDGLTGPMPLLPAPDLFLAMHVRQEAVLSSQIEGTQSTLDDVLTFEVDPDGRGIPRDVEDVVNYVHAMNFGLARLAELPLSLRLIREIHAELMRGVRGADKQPGEFRATQNWIGAGLVPLQRASFVPPPVPEMWQALDNFERFLHEGDDGGNVLPPLLCCGVAHAQFETIHPFLDGNGRVGRLLITLLLCYRRVLGKPLLYLSLYLKRHRTEYYDRLIAIREQGDWEGWLRFFLRGVAETAEEAAETVHAIAELREQHRALVERRRLGSIGSRALDVLFQQPVVNVKWLQERLGVAYVTANKVVTQFQALGLLEETTGGRRWRRFRYAPYLALFEEQGMDYADTPPQSTESGAPV